MKKLASNSIYIFMAADNNLDASGVKDIQEMTQSDISPDINVIVEFDRRHARFLEASAKYKTKRLKIENHKIIEKQDIGETNTGDPLVLNDFLKWGVKNFPADRKMAIIWNHGGGAKDVNIYKSLPVSLKRTLFIPEEIRGIRGFQFPEFGSGELPDEINVVTSSGKIEEISSIKMTPDIRKMVTGSLIKNFPLGIRLDKSSKEYLNSFKQKYNYFIPVCREVSFDDTARDFLDNVELKNAACLPNHKFDFIAFDACLMSMLEVVFQIKECTDYVIGSEEIEPSDGWPYKLILNYLSENPTVKNETLVKEIVSLYAEYYKDTSECVTQAAIQTSNLDKTARTLDDFAAVLLKSLNSFKPILSDILGTVQRFRDGDYIDLYDFVLLCQKNISDVEVNRTSGIFIESLSESIIKNTTQGEKLKLAHGLSIYFPHQAPTEEILKTYSKLDFVVAYPNWLNLINTFHTPSTLVR
jgi:hypothetical protein